MDFSDTSDVFYCFAFVFVICNTPFYFSVVFLSNTMPLLIASRLVLFCECLPLSSVAGGYVRIGILMHWDLDEPIADFDLYDNRVFLILKNPTTYPGMSLHTMPLLT